MARLRRQTTGKPARAGRQAAEEAAPAHRLMRVPEEDRRSRKADDGTAPKGTSVPHLTAKSGVSLAEPSFTIPVTLRGTIMQAEAKRPRRREN
jgi:hypothetical protein